MEWYQLQSQTTTPGTYPGALVCLRAHAGRDAREKNGKFVGKRLVTEEVHTEVALQVNFA